jgi:hypothetical protein
MAAMSAEAGFGWGNSDSERERATSGPDGEEENGPPTRARSLALR